MGSVVALPLAGVLCQHGFAGGWPSVFYLIGESPNFMFFIFTLVKSESESEMFIDPIHTAIQKQC